MLYHEGHVIAPVKETSDNYRAVVLGLSTTTEERVMGVLKATKKRLEDHDGQIVEGHSLLEAERLRLIEFINNQVNYLRQCCC